MISYQDLESAFSLADDNTDGLITFSEALEATEGNQTRAAERLGISRNGLILRMKRLGIASSTGRPTQKRGFRAEPTPDRLRRPRPSASDDPSEG